VARASSVFFTAPVARQGPGLIRVSGAAMFNLTAERCWASVHLTTDKMRAISGKCPVGQRSATLCRCHCPLGGCTNACAQLGRSLTGCFAHALRSCAGLEQSLMGFRIGGDEGLNQSFFAASEGHSIACLFFRVATVFLRQAKPGEGRTDFCRAPPPAQVQDPRPWSGSVLQSCPDGTPPSWHIQRRITARSPSAALQTCAKAPARKNALGWWVFKVKTP